MELDTAEVEGAREFLQRIVAEHKARMDKSIQIIFLAAIQHSQIAKSENPDDDHVYGRVVFLMNDGQGLREMHAVVRQSPGTDYESSPIQFTGPSGEHRTPFPYQDFTDHVEAYYRSHFGKDATSFQFSAVAGQENAAINPSPPIVLTMPDDHGSGGGWLLERPTRWMMARRHQNETTPLRVAQDPRPQSQPSNEGLDRDQPVAKD